MEMLPEYRNGLPNLCGEEGLLARTMAAGSPEGAWRDFGGLRSAFAIALHMHQPLIPGGQGDLRTAAVISNLRHMMEHPEIPDAHNAPVFKWCYQRMAQFIPDLLRAGQQPRIMLDYSGCLFHGLREMGADDVMEDLKRLTTDPGTRDCVEWLGTAWGHAVAPSTPPQDFRLHVRAWQHHFAAIFGLDALARVRGFSLPEMALPNHPDVAYELVKTLVDAGYRYVIVQEHSVEQCDDGKGIRRPHIPHELIARNSRGQSARIIAMIKTQGSDVKLVAQMQPYHEARTLSRVELGGRQIPPLVTQISDGENGGVMMNEFPPMYIRTTTQACHTDTPAMNITEYLDALAAVGVGREAFPKIQPIFQHRIWEKFDPGEGEEKLRGVLESLSAADSRFHVEGASWTADKSWVKGYDDVLAPMEQASALFSQEAAGMDTQDPRYQNALYHLLMSQCSCYRYWGQGTWTDYGKELCRRALGILETI